MDRALDLRLLGGALEGIGNLPSPAELRQLLADAEVDSFFAGTTPLGPELLETAWNLHHIGTVRPALELYGAERQVQCNVVAAHIFDLALGNPALNPGERLVLTFASQVSYIRGDRTPNAAALGRRLPDAAPSLRQRPGQTALELGCALLSLDRARTTALLRQLYPQLAAYDSTVGPQGDLTSHLASAASVVRGVRLFQQYLTRGDPANLDAARAEFERGATAPGSSRDLDSRWVAAHLLDLCDDLGNSSVWAVLPEGTPPAAAMSMTLGDPPLMALWPPQISLLTDPAHNPLRPDMKRSVLTFPTSAGKSLLTQLVVVHHLATEPSGVCIVAPSHSLCREIRQGLDRRLWVLRKRVEEDGPLGDRAAPVGEVMVMTPEKLAARLRASEAQLIADFGLFILDEAHLVADESRGWTFETTIARLHELTAGTSHRIVIASAALGGTTSVHSWLDSNAPPTSEAARWRGPRRLHATYTPEPVPGSSRTAAPTGRQKTPRVSRELRGVVQLFVDQGTAVATRSTKLGVEVYARKQRIEGPSRAKQLTPVVLLASKSGSVLTVHARKKTAEDLAKALADHLPERVESGPVRRLAEQRLGDRHPLVDVLAHGVAYHHAALPSDIQAEIETAVRSGALQIVCATTTLTDGLNLPVRTVVVCDRGYPDTSGFHQLIDSADLLNAAGRAGRAGRETEGWVIVAKEPMGPNPRNALLALDDNQDIRSVLNTTTALAALSEYETLLSTTAELTLKNVPREVDSFLSYCWYLADSAPVLDPDARAAAVLAGIRHTLAWHQLPEAIRGRWEAVAHYCAVAYELSPPERRRRWARTGTPLSANSVLEQVAAEAAPAVAALGPGEAFEPMKLLGTLLGGERLELLLSLVPERDRRFKRRRYGPTQRLDVDVRGLIVGWVAGQDLVDLANTYLTEVEGGDEDAFRFEQLSGFLASVCEHHLPWTLGIIMEWVTGDTGASLPVDLPAYVHFGVAEPTALELLKRGVRSRRLAVAVAREAGDASVGPADIRSWLSQLGPAEWRRRFGAGAAEVTDLLQYLHDPAAGTSASLLEGGTAGVAVEPIAGATMDDQPLIVQYADDSERLRRVAVVRPDHVPVALVAAAAHHDLATLLDAGFRLLATWDPTGTAITVRMEDD